MKLKGRKDVVEAVAIAALSTLAVRGIDLLFDHLERRKAKKGKGKRK